MNPRLFKTAAAFLILFWATPDLYGAIEWRVQARLEIDAPGIVEAVLPPELHSSAKTDNLDLELTGPDGNPRSFELYWREPVGRSEIELAPDKFQFGKKKEFIWEGKTDKKIMADRIRIQIRDHNFVGRVDVEAYGPGGWTYLRRNEALFKTGGQGRAELEIEKGIYSRLRLRFSSFDKEYEEKFAPISNVILSGEKPGKDYVERFIRPAVRQMETDGKTEIRTILPGSGLWLQSITFRTQAQFQGSWRLGTEAIEQGKQAFLEIKSGDITRVSKERQLIAIDSNLVWPGRNLILRLDPKGKYIGAVSEFKIKVRLPRMVFSADAPGVYTAKAGAGKNAAVYQYPGDRERLIDQTAVFSAPDMNKNWRPESLVEKYGIEGGPFNDKGFTWKSAVTVSEPGYYRLILNMNASHAKNRTGIRLIKDDTQIPFFFGRVEAAEVDLTAAASSEYHSDKNQTALTVELPYASSNWSELYLYANGIFKRRIRIEIPKPANIGWQRWGNCLWENHANRETRLSIDLSRYPENQNRIRVIIDHGDNQPLKINRIAVSYSSPSIHFLAHEKGEYWLYGGNPQAPAPKYDLSLVQAYLLAELPAKAEMGPLQSFHPESWKGRFAALFKGRGWGLYGVLGLVTIVLLILIAKLFPKVSKTV